MPNDRPDWFTLAPIARGSLVVGVGLTGSLTFSLPPDTQAVSILMAQNLSVDQAVSKVIGQTTGLDYSRVSVGSLGNSVSVFARLRQMYVLAIDAGNDSSLTVTLKPTGPQVTAYFSAWPQAPTGWLVDNQLAPVALIGQDNEVTRQLPDWQVNNQVNGAGTASVGSGSSAGHKAQVQEVIFRAIANTGRVFQARVWDGASGGTLLDEQWIGNPGGAAPTSPDTVVFHDLASSGGNALTFDFDTACNAGERQSIGGHGQFK